MRSACAVHATARPSFSAVSHHMLLAWGGSPPVRGEPTRVGGPGSGAVPHLRRVLGHATALAAGRHARRRVGACADAVPRGGGRRATESRHDCDAVAGDGYGWKRAPASHSTAGAPSGECDVGAAGTTTVSGHRREVVPRLMRWPRPRVRSAVPRGARPSHSREHPRTRTRSSAGGCGRGRRCDVCVPTPQRRREGSTGKEGAGRGEARDSSGTAGGSCEARPFCHQHVVGTVPACQTAQAWPVHGKRTANRSHSSAWSGSMDAGKERWQGRLPPSRHSSPEAGNTTVSRVPVVGAREPFHGTVQHTRTGGGREREAAGPQGLRRPPALLAQGGRPVRKHVTGSSPAAAERHPHPCSPAPAAHPPGEKSGPKEYRDARTGVDVKTP